MTTRRLIAPVTEGWNRGERDWSFVADPSSEIECFEREAGLGLPDGDRRFMRVLLDPALAIVRRSPTGTTISLDEPPPRGDAR